MADLDHPRTNEQIAAEAGVSERTLYNLKNDPDFMSRVADLTEQAIDAFRGELYRALMAKVRKGDTKAMELMMKRFGLLIDRKEVSTESKVEIIALAGKSNEDIAKEIAAKEALLLTEIDPDAYTYLAGDDADVEVVEADADNADDMDASDDADNADAEAV